MHRHGGGNDKLFARGIDPTLDGSGEVVHHAAPEGSASVVGGAGDDTLIVGEDDYAAGGPGSHDHLWYQSFMSEGGNALQFSMTEFQRLIGTQPIPEGIEDQHIWLRVVTPIGSAAGSRAWSPSSRWRWSDRVGHAASGMTSLTSGSSLTSPFSTSAIAAG